MQSMMMDMELSAQVSGMDSNEAKAIASCGGLGSARHVDLK